jgi:hypothetical protein
MDGLWETSRRTPCQTFQHMLRMKPLLALLPLVLMVCSCGEKTTIRPASLPDNVTSDKPIVLKEGQAVVFMKEGDRNLMVAATVTDGKLSIGEVDQKGRSFSVAWKDSETWETSTQVNDGEDVRTVMDKDMDGHADFKAEAGPSGVRRFRKEGEEWLEVKTGNADPATTE